VTPDAMTFAKGLGNGLAIGGVVARPELMDSLTANSISTFGGNPLATAAAGATLEFLLSHDLQGNAAKLGARLISGLRETASKCAIIGDVRGKGLMIGIELIGPDGAPNRAATNAVHELAMRRGLLIGKGGLHGNVLRLSPPMTLTETELDEALTILADVLTDVDSSTAVSPADRTHPRQE
jgi:4-aminobutyrate aminotransferase